MSHKSSGFTLLEVLLAAALLGLISMTLLRAFSSVTSTTSTQTAATSLETQLQTVATVLQTEAEKYPLAGFLQGNQQAFVAVRSIGSGNTPDQDTDFPTASRLTFVSSVPQHPVHAGILFNGTSTAVMLNVYSATEHDVQIAPGCTPGIDWKPQVQYHPASFFEVGLGSALKGFYPGLNLNDRSLYYRTDDGRWIALLDDVSSFSIDYVYRTATGSYKVVQPSQPWARDTTNGDTDKTTLPKLGFLDPNTGPYYFSEAVVHISMKENDVERTTNVLLTFPKAQPNQMRLNYCEDPHNAVGDLYIDIRYDNQVTPNISLAAEALRDAATNNQGINIKGPDPGASNQSYGGSVYLSNIAVGTYTIHAPKIGLDSHGHYTTSAPINLLLARVDPDLKPYDDTNPRKLEEIYRPKQPYTDFTAVVRSWRPTQVTIVYDEAPGLLRITKALFNCPPVLCYPLPPFNGMIVSGPQDDIYVQGYMPVPGLFWDVPDKIFHRNPGALSGLVAGRSVTLPAGYTDSFGYTIDHSIGPAFYGDNHEREPRNLLSRLLGRFSEALSWGERVYAYAKPGTYSIATQYWRVSPALKFIFIYAYPSFCIDLPIQDIAKTEVYSFSKNSYLIANAICVP